MNPSSVLIIEGPAEPVVPLVLDSPHSGRDFPPDFDAVVSPFDLRDGEDCYVDDLYRPSTEHGIALLSTRVPRTYLDANRHAGDIDLELIEGGHWPHAMVPSGKARLGKALVWRTSTMGGRSTPAGCASRRCCTGSSAAMRPTTPRSLRASRRRTRASA
jgi:N-formylglutamate deformylase